MQDSNRITLLGFIMVNFKTKSPQNQFKTNPEVTVSKKKILFIPNIPLYSL